MALASAKMAIGTTKVGKYSYPFKMERGTYLAPAAPVVATPSASASASIDPMDATPSSTSRAPAAGQGVESRAVGAVGSVGASSTSAAASRDSSASNAPWTLTQDRTAAHSPLKWFGYVVPASLRTSQRKFVQGRTQCVAVAACSRMAAVLTAPLSSHTLLLPSNRSL
jgi:hypothetical protein